ncbi:MAG: hypothetical protein IT219_01930 [Bacteroidales bacterium]|nr:hypothetical protein [Bacteroidales bacterium]
MEEFHYYNMFETKGFEYILTIVFFALLIPFWMILNKKRRISHQLQKAAGVLNAKRLALPQGVYHSPGHTWMHLLKSGKARVGLSGLLVKITGNVQIIPLKAAGDMTQKGEIIAVLKQNDKTINIVSPLTGKILHYPEIDSENLLTDPYGKGWLMEIEPTAWIVETQAYFLADKVTHWAEKEIVRFKDFLAETMPKHDSSLAAHTLQDGGELREYCLTDLSKEVWADFDVLFVNV